MDMVDNGSKPLKITEILEIWKDNEEEAEVMLRKRLKFMNKPLCTLKDKPIESAILEETEHTEIIEPQHSPKRQCQSSIVDYLDFQKESK